MDDAISIAAAAPGSGALLSCCGAGKTFGYDLAMWNAIANQESVVFVDPKASIYPISRRRAKRRLMRAGVTPAAAARTVEEAAAAGYLRAPQILQSAMRTGKRHASRWFPFDTIIRQEGNA